MNTSIEIARSLLSPPGDTIQEHIDYIGMSQAELAERMGRPKEKINDLIHGREPISTSTAYQLEKVLSIPASFWMNRESTYRQELYELEQKEKAKKDLEWLQSFPIRKMKDLGWIPDVKEKHILIDSLLKFFGVASTTDWNRIYLAEEVSVAFRISLAHTKSPHAISAWLRQGEVEAGKMKLDDFNKKGFKDSLTEIKELAYLLPNDYLKQLQKICAECGVALVYTPNLPKAPISGATRWHHQKPIIQLSGRFKTDDHFWFTFFHEAGHIILHGKKDVFLEEVEGSEMDQQKEKEANEFAEKRLLPDKELKEILQSGIITEKEIGEFSNKFRTPPGVIVGRLQHMKRVPFNFGSGFKRKIELF
ncbi:MAG: ImmA/IrrE family metallo-endopeptidase [Saprospiraceae bacterium]